MNEKELKPCPLCGGGAFTQIFEPHSHHLEFIPDHPGSATVECSNCPCAIIKDTLEEAIACWNTRAPDPMLEDLAGALEKACDSVCELIDNSRGVDGLHLNGDVAAWDDLRSGGMYEGWLVEFDGALDVLQKYQQSKEKS